MSKSQEQAATPISPQVFHEILSDVIRASGSKPHELANKWNISSSEYKRLVAGEVYPSNALFKRIAQTLIAMNRRDLQVQVIERNNAMRAQASNESQEPEAPAPSETKPPKTFGEALAQARKTEGLTMGDVAALVAADGVALDSKSVWWWENDQNAPIQAHYDALVSLFPELKDAPKPDSQDIEKPGHRSGHTSKEAAALPPPVPIQRPSSGGLGLVENTQKREVILPPSNGSPRGAAHL